MSQNISSTTAEFDDAHMLRPLVDVGADGLDSQRLRAALADANLPTLQMVLVHLTGERRWLQTPYIPTRGRGLDDNDSGGYSTSVQREIRAAAFRAVVEWYGGDRAAREIPSDELVEMFNVSVSADVGPEYSELLAVELGQKDPLADLQRAVSQNPLSVLIVGAGVSGLAMAVSLERLGVPYLVVEKSDSIGGTWYENQYPGCGCDSPSHLYSFHGYQESEQWTRYYAGRDEIHKYLNRYVEDHQLAEKVRTSCELIEARWDTTDAKWLVRIREIGGAEQELVANVVVNATGMLNKPFTPSIAGLDTFAGPQFHTARWPEEFEVTRKRIAVIGTGASAMQLVPAIAGRAAHVTVFQRSPQWAMPNPNYKRTVSAHTRYLMSTVPYYAAWYRVRLHWIVGDRLHGALQVDPKWGEGKISINRVNDGVRRFLSKYMAEELGGRAEELLPKVLPNYPPFLKRMLMDNNWFRTLRRDDVELVTESIHRIHSGSIETNDGSAYEVDAIVFATGFATLDYLGGTDFQGREGASLHAVWGEHDAKAHLGITVPKFPNLFFLYGPNTNSHAGSVIWQSEREVNYVALLLDQMLKNGIAVVECRQDILERYVKQVDDAHSRMVWTDPRATTYYRNERGRVVNNSPWRHVDYFNMTRQPRLADYEIQLTDAGTVAPIC